MQLFFVKNAIFLPKNAKYIEITEKRIWRYFNHWAYDAADILSMPNRSWFIIALNRLAELCKDEQEK